MAQGYVYFRAGMTTAERQALLSSEQITAVIHASPTVSRFDRNLPVALLPTGQAFGSLVEVRWQPDGVGGWELLLLSESRRRELHQAGWQETPMDVDDEEQSIILWGNHWTYLDGANPADETLQEWGWVQAQIEADLQYPVVGSKSKPMVKVKAKTYRRKGIVQLTRFIDVYPDVGVERSGV